VFLQSGYKIQSHKCLLSHAQEVSNRTFLKKNEGVGANQEEGTDSVIEFVWVVDGTDDDEPCSQVGPLC
jgi:hypothetical protein